MFILHTQDMAVMSKCQGNMCDKEDTVQSISYATIEKNMYVLRWPYSGGHNF